MPYFDFPVDIAVTWHYPSPTTIFNSAYTILMFEVRTRHICLFFLTAIRCEYGRSLTASNASSDDVLLKKKRFSTDLLLVDQPLGVRQYPFKTALTASLVYVCIYFLSRTPPFPQAPFLLVPDQSMVFEVFEPRIQVPHIELPLSASHCLTVSFVTGNVRLTRLQTDKHNHLFLKTLLSVEGTPNPNLWYLVSSISST